MDTNDIFREKKPMRDLKLPNFGSFEKIPNVNDKIDFITKIPKEINEISLSEVARKGSLVRRTDLSSFGFVHCNNCNKMNPAAYLIYKEFILCLICTDNILESNIPIKYFPSSIL